MNDQIVVAWGVSLLVHVESKRDGSSNGWTVITYTSGRYPNSSNILLFVVGSSTTKSKRICDSTTQSATA
jgi:hypothetical protein